MEYSAFDIQNFKDGTADGLLHGRMPDEDSSITRSITYKDGYDFGLYLWNELEVMKQDRKVSKLHESYDYGDYLLIRHGKVIAVSGNTEFYGEYNNCYDCPKSLEYVDGDVIVKVVQVGQYTSKEDNDE